MKRNLTEEDTDMANKHMRKCSASLAIREIPQNHNEIPPHTSENGENQQDRKQQMLERMWRRESPLALLVGVQTVTATLENCVEVPQDVKNRAIL